MTPGAQGGTAKDDAGQGQKSAKGAWVTGYICGQLELSPTGNTPQDRPLGGEGGWCLNPSALMLHGPGMC